MVTYEQKLKEKKERTNYKNWNKQHPCNLCGKQGISVSLNVYLGEKYADEYDFCEEHAIKMLDILEQNGFIKTV
jgi:hypothetical protein